MPTASSKGMTFRPCAEPVHAVRDGHHWLSGAPMLVSALNYGHGVLEQVVVREIPLVPVLCDGNYPS